MGLVKSVQEKEAKTQHYSVKEILGLKDGGKIKRSLPPLGMMPPLNASTSSVYLLSLQRKEAHGLCMNPNRCGAFGFDVFVWISSSFAPYSALETTEVNLTGWNLVLLVVRLILSAHTFQTFTDKCLLSLPRHLACKACTKV